MICQQRRIKNLCQEKETNKVRLQLRNLEQIKKENIMKQIKTHLNPKMKIKQKEKRNLKKLKL